MAQATISASSSANPAAASAQLTGTEARTGARGTALGGLESGSFAIPLSPGSIRIVVSSWATIAGPSMVAPTGRRSRP